MENENKESESFLDHLIALRKSLVKSLIALVLTSGVCLFFAKDFYTILIQPLKKSLPEDSFFITTHPLEAWMTYLKVGLLAGVFFACPIIFYQLWKFVAPGLIKREKKYAWFFVLFSSLFFVGGALFGYFYVFPFGFAYFISILEGTHILFLPQMKDAFSFIARMLFAFGIIFELPLLVFVLGLSGLVSFSSLMKFQKYLVVLAFVVGAILTPPDVITQIFMALPIILLYQVGVIAAWMVTRKRKKLTP